MEKLIEVNTPADEVELEVIDQSNFQAGKKEYMASAINKAKTFGIELKFNQDVYPLRKYAMWYTDDICTLKFSDTLKVVIQASAEVEAVLNGEETLGAVFEFEDAGIYTDKDVSEYKKNGVLEFEQYGAISFYIQDLKSNKHGIHHIKYFSELGYDEMGSLDEALDFEFFAKSVIPDYLNEYHPENPQLKEEKEDDVELEAIDPIGDAKSGSEKFKRGFIDTASKYGAKLTFKTEVYPKRLEALWYNDEVATLKKDGIEVVIFSTGGYVAINDEYLYNEKELEENGVFKDSDMYDNEDVYVDENSYFDFYVNFKGVYTSRQELGLGPIFGLVGALDIDYYINTVIPKFKEKYSSKLKEEKEDDIELEPTPLNINDFNFFQETKYKDRPFFIINIDEAKEELHTEEYSELEEIIDSMFGSDNWGSSESWYTCDSCYKAIYLDDYYSHDYYYPYSGGIICGDCVRESPEDYIEHITNNSDIFNTLLDVSVLEDAGFKLYSSRALNRSEARNTLKTLMKEYPGGQFIFDFQGYGEFLIYARNVGDDLTEDKEGKQRFTDKFGSELSDRFFRLKARLKSPEKDISYWMKKKPEDLLTRLDGLEKIKTAKQKSDTAREGAKLLYSDEDWSVYEISTLEASIKYGKGTKWCISGIDCETPESWNRYRKNMPGFPEDKSVFIFFINKTYSDKYAVLYNKETKKYLIWNDIDNPVSFILEAPKVKGLPDFSAIPAELRKGLADGLGVSTDKIISIVNCYECMFQDDHLEKYSVEYRDTDGFIVVQNLYRSPESDEFVTLEYDYA